MSRPSLVTIVDDDESVRESLPDLLRMLGYRVEAFCSAQAFLKSASVGKTDCLILDIAMPGMSGPDLQRELERSQRSIPIIFITANGDEAVRRRLMKQGAAEVLFKPFSDVDLREALASVLTSK